MQYAGSRAVQSSTHIECHKFAWTCPTSAQGERCLAVLGGAQVGPVLCYCQRSVNRPASAVGAMDITEWLIAATVHPNYLNGTSARMGSMVQMVFPTHHQHIEHTW